MVSSNEAGREGECAHQQLSSSPALYLARRGEPDSLAELVGQDCLAQVLPEYRQPADIWAVYTAPLDTSTTTRVTVEFFRRYSRAQRAAM